MTDRATRLEAFVQGATDPAVWCVNDCTMWAASWVESERSVVIPKLPYSNEAEAKALIAEHGGLVSIWSAALGSVGLRETEYPRLGDVAIIDTRIHGPIGVIFADGGIALRRRLGGGVWAFSTAMRTLIKAWAV